jgi:L,D-peptidoglycan transpeptidase YkuD (ErfK/YbiS/YcfS/YnhG family)
VLPEVTSSTRHNGIPAAAPSSRQRTSSSAPARTTSAPAPVRGQALPVAGSTISATRVITVLAAHRWSTTATLQAWDRAPGGGWLKHGGPVMAHVGSQGLTTTPSESLSATPIGSFTLTQAFGWKTNPGTGLAYFRTNSADWWISQAGPLYNTHQHCSSGCRFDTTISENNVNEHLSAIGVYAEAVVIDYNTRNSATGVQQGKGSAFFLHVTDGTATAGCVAIPEANLVSIMKWLTPAARPRILIGVSG